VVGPDARLTANRPVRSASVSYGQFGRPLGSAIVHVFVSPLIVITIVAVLDPS
jgi:hypothetical protein